MLPPALRATPDLDKKGRTPRPVVQLARPGMCGMSQAWWVPTILAELAPALGQAETPRF